MTSMTKQAQQWADLLQETGLRAFCTDLLTVTA
jgi:hypothetical protein